MAKISIDSFRVSNGKSFKLAKHKTDVKKLYKDDVDYSIQLGKMQEQIDELQQKMYAHDRYSMLLLFQAMDAAGKDGTIRKIMSSVNVHGVSVHAFKKPSDEELDHDFLWRTTKELPQRGRIAIFNRSYYEEVLIVKVHPEILTKYQKLPAELTKKPKDVWAQRYETIRDYEQHLVANGTRVVKCFLNISKDEQRDRFISRIDEPEKNWKFSEVDVQERKYWKDYQRAYEDAICATASKNAPWYVIPADDKKNMHLISASILLNELKQLDTCYPKVTADRKAELEKYKAILLEQ